MVNYVYNLKVNETEIDYAARGYKFESNFDPKDMKSVEETFRYAAKRTNRCVRKFRVDNRAYDLSGKQISGKALYIKATPTRVSELVARHARHYQKFAKIGARAARRFLKDVCAQVLGKKPGFYSYLIESGNKDAPVILNYFADKLRASGNQVDRWSAALLESIVSMHFVEEEKTDFRFFKNPINPNYSDLTRFRKIF